MLFESVHLEDVKMEWKADDRDAYLSFLSTNPSSIHKRHRHIKSRIEESVSRKLIDGETLLARLQTQKHIPTGCTVTSSFPLRQNGFQAKALMPFLEAVSKKTKLPKSTDSVQRAKLNCVIQVEIWS